MKKCLFLISLFLFACKKNDTYSPIVSANQFPITIDIYNVDVSTNVASLDVGIRYFYNTNNRIDSIKILNQTYQFDYTELSANGKVLVNTSGSTSHNELLTYDNSFYNLTSYMQMFGVNDTSKTTFQFDSISRLKRFEYRYNNSTNDFIITQTYKKDSVFVYHEFFNSSCVSNDTIKNSTQDMSKTLPYLLFTRTNNDCGIVLFQNALSALPLSSFTYKLPQKVISNNKQVDYTYQFDDNERLVQSDVVTKQRSTNTIIAKKRIKVSY